MGRTITVFLGSRVELTDDLRDDLADARHELRVMTSLYQAAFGVAADAMVEIDRLRRQVQELHEERARIARDVFGPGGVDG